MDSIVLTRKNIYLILSVVAFLFGLYLARLYDFLLFHTLAEMFSIIIAFSVFRFAWNSRFHLENDFYLLIGIGFLFVGALDLLHTMTYMGMGIFKGYDANLPTQLWIAARFIQGTSFLLAFFFLHRRVNSKLAYGGFSLIFLLIVLSLFLWKIFPDCYLEGKGMTLFKIVSEYFLSLLFAASGFLLLIHRSQFDQDIFRLLILSLVFMILGELAFTFYVGVYDLSNLIGHLLKIISFFLLDLAIVQTGLLKPYTVLLNKFKANEENLKIAYTQLEQQVEEQKKINRELESFSYIISHDLKTPLRGIDGYSRILLEDYGSSLTEDGRQLLNKLVQSADRMNQLIEGLLAYSRLDRQLFNPKPSNPIKIIEALMEERRADLSKRAVHLNNDGNCASLNVDPVGLSLALGHLLDNAIKATAQTANPAIEIGCRESEKGTILWVKDNGIGFDMKDYPRLFTVFQRLSSLGGYDGIGIGLAMVRKVMERMGGRAWGEGETGRGAIFFLELPE